MAGLIEDDADVEMARYEEAYQIKTHSGLSPDSLRGGTVQYDPIKKVEAVYVDLPSGGKLRIGDRPVTPMQVAQTDAVAAEKEQMLAPQAEVASETPIPTNGRAPIESILGGENGPELEDYMAAGYSESEALQYEQFRNQQYMQNPNISDVVKLTPAQVEQYAAQPGSEIIAPQGAGVRGTIQDWVYNALDPNREPTGGASDALRSAFSMLPGTENLDPGDLRFFSNLFTNFADVTVPGVGGSISIDEGSTMMSRGFNMLSSGNPEQMASGAVDMTVGAALTTLGVAEFVPFIKSLGDPAKGMLRKMSPEAKNLLADTIGLSRAVTQGDKDMLIEIFQPRGKTQSLSAAAVGPKNFTLAAASDEPMIGQLAPQYRVRVEGFTPEGKGTQSFIPQMMTPQNRDVADQKLTTLATEFPDPLSSPEEYAGMMARVRNTNEVPAPPYWMIENANNPDQWADWFSGLTPDQIKAADDGLSIQQDFRNAYADPNTGPELTGQLMFWSIMSRMLSAFPHESGFLELAESADPYIKKAIAGDWTEETTAEWRNMVSSTIPLDSPGRSATSNANAFGETFLRKMSAKDENGVSALERLHRMIADPNMSSAQIRREYYGLAQETGIANKILSFALLVAGRNDVVVLDRIQINRMWGAGEKIYDDIMKQFEGAQGLAQYEALERSLASRVGDIYQKVGRAADSSVGRYHWESWVLSSGQVVSHPTLESVVRAGTPNVPRSIPATSNTPVMEGRFHTKYSGVQYEKRPDGSNRYIYKTSKGEPYQFTKAQLDAMFDEAFKKKAEVLPPDFPGVKAFEGGNIPWYEFKGVNRGKLDELIRSSGKPAPK